MDSSQKALTVIIWMSATIIGAAMVFLFAELGADVGFWARILPTGSKVTTGQSGGYTIGLVMLMIGAAFMMVPVVAGRACPSNEREEATKPQDRVTVVVIVAALAFLFIQLLADTIFRGADRSAGSQSGAYTIGLVILMVGAALMIVSIVASRPPAPTQPAAAQGDPKDRLLTFEQRDIKPGSPHTQTKVSLEVTAGMPQPTTGDPPANSAPGS